MPGRLSAEHPHRPLFSIIAGLMSFAAVTACGAKADTNSDTTATEQALTEAQSSYGDAQQAAEACFTAFEACSRAPGADIVGCKTTLGECLPKEAGPGPHCGGPPPGEHPGGPRGDCKGPPPGGDPNDSGGPEGAGHRTGPAKGPGTDGPSSTPPPPPVDGKGSGEGGPAGGPGKGPGSGPSGDGGGEGHPGFCKHVPLPPPPELKACHDALQACVAAKGDRKACFDADRACVKAAFDAKFAELCASNPTDERLAKLCAGGVAPAEPPPPPPVK